MLVCAPTGAGKTNTAMLCIAREIQQRHLAGEPWKIIYVAPMKALASEMVRTFTERLRYYKVRVEEVTGDTNVNKGDMEKTQVTKFIEIIFSTVLIVRRSLEWGKNKDCYLEIFSDILQLIGLFRMRNLIEIKINFTNSTFTYWKCP